MKERFSSWYFWRTYRLLARRWLKFAIASWHSPAPALYYTHYPLLENQPDKIDKCSKPWSLNFMLSTMSACKEKETFVCRRRQQTAETDAALSLSLSLIA